jgi:hypothetical protein
MHRDGYGLLTIHNKWTMDTVAVLTDAGSPYDNDFRYFT